MAQALSAYFGDALPLDVHLNADEAPALGAAFEAANISTAFKVLRLNNRGTCLGKLHGGMMLSKRTFKKEECLNGFECGVFFAGASDGHV